MAYEVASIFTLKDHFTDGIMKMISGQKQFKKESEMLKNQLELLYDKKKQLKIDTKEADKAIKKTMKLGGDLKDSVSKKIELELQASKAEREIKATLKQLKEVDKQIDGINKKSFGPKSSNNGSNMAASFNKSSILKMVGGLGILGAGAYAVNKATDATTYALGLSGQMEQTEVAFKNMMKSKTDGDKLMNDLKSFAVRTPYEFADLAENTRFAMAMNFNRDEILGPDLKSGLLVDVGNAAAGLGKGAEGVESMIRALGQIRAKGKVSAEEINQLAENGVGAWDYIAKAINKTTAETMKLGEKGLLPAEKAIAAIRKGLRDDYGGMMDEQSKTWLGLTSSIKDFVSLNIFTKFGDGIRLGVQPYLQKLTDMLTNSPDKVVKFQKKIEDFGRSIGTFVSDKANRLTQYFESLFNNPAFQNADLGGKAKIVLDGMLASVKQWVEGDGGEKISKSMEIMARKAMDAVVTVAKEYVPQIAKIGLDIGSAMASGIGEAATKKVDNSFFVQSKSMEEKFALDKGSTIGRLKILGGLTKDEFMQSNDFEIAQNYFKRQLDAGLKTKEQLLSENPWAKGVIPGFAFGKGRIPYDNYPALLHEGEKVLTKQEASQTSSGAIIIQKIAENVIIREDADIAKIVKELIKELRGAQAAYGGEY